MNTVDQLTRILHTELALVAEYEAGLPKIIDPYIRQQLEECQRSHQMRVDILREEVEDIGGEIQATASPITDYGIGITCDTTTQGGTLLALAAIEAAWLNSYRTCLDKVDFDLRDLIEHDLLPEQERTYEIMQMLKQEH